MKLEAVRIIVDALQDATYGVNALLATVPRDASDQEPPQLVEIYDDTRDGWLARGELPTEMRAAEKCPFLVVSLLGDVDFGGRSRPTRDAGGVVSAELTIAIGYVTHESLTEQGQQDAMYTMRAVRSSLQRLASPEGASARDRNYVQLEVLKNVKELRGFEPLEDKVMIPEIVVTTWSARETSW